MYILFLLSAWCVYRLPLLVIQLNLAFIWYSLKHPRMNSLTSHILHFSCLSISPSFKRRFIAIVMKWNYNSILIHCELTENWMHFVSQLSLFATVERTIFSCSRNGRVWHWCTKQRNVLSWIPILSLFYHPSQQSRIPKKRSKNVNLANRITN
jgi:hypothetical protein